MHKGAATNRTLILLYLLLIITKLLIITCF